MYNCVYTVNQESWNTAVSQLLLQYSISCSGTIVCVAGARVRVITGRANCWLERRTRDLQDSTDNGSIDKAETSLD